MFGHVPGGGAVPVEDVKVLAGEQLAAVDARLDSAEASQNSHLLDVADQRHNVQPLELGVDGVEAANEVLEKELKGLRQTEHRIPSDDEGSHLLTAIVDQLALVGRGIAGGDGRRALV